MINELSINDIRTEKQNESKKNVSFDPKHASGINQLFRASLEKIIRDKDKLRHQSSIKSKVNSEKIVKTESKKNKSSITELHKQNNKEHDEFLIEFPEFFEIDLLEDEQDIVSNKKEADGLDTQHSFQLELSIDSLLDFLKENKITIYPVGSFELEPIIYCSREGVTKGYLQNHDTLCDVFVKMYTISSYSHLEIILNELTVITTLSDNHIDNLNFFYGVHIDKENNLLYSFFEYLPKENNLKKKMKNLNKYQKLIVLKNLLQFILNIHSLGIVHRDLRLEYFFLDSKLNLKIFDFSNSIKMEILNTQNQIEISQGIKIPPTIVEEKVDTSLNKTSQRKSKNENEGVSNIENNQLKIEEPNLSQDNSQIKVNYKYFKKRIPYLTAKYTAPEITLCNSREGPAQDIWSLGCIIIELFINYTKYDKIPIDILLNKIFRSRESIIKRIPRDIEHNMATILVKCFDPDPITRIDILGLINEFNEYFKNNNYKGEIDKGTKKKYLQVQNAYKEEYKKRDKNSKEIKEFSRCKYHANQLKSFYCENEGCDDFYCYYCISLSHEQHCYFNIEIDLECKSKILLNYLSEGVEDLFIDTYYKQIDDFRGVFEKDYDDEEKRIQHKFIEIRKKIDHLESLQLANLRNSREDFLKSKFHKLFEDAQLVEKFSEEFYRAKDEFFSHFNRFYYTLLKEEVNIENLKLFNKKYNKFNEFSERFKFEATRLKKKSEGLRIPGKYIFRQEHFTDEFMKYLKSVESKIFLEKHKFFDYSGNDSLYLKEELLMIIPLTDCVFSYIKNSYFKIPVNFDLNNIKIKSFLPGCATLHMNGRIYITGGELKDEAVAEFLHMNVMDKVVEEGTEMNYSRRYHTMVNINNKYICVLGGWNSNEVEILDVETLNDNWRILPTMHYVRADSTVYFFNQSFLYVIGGWDYSMKSCHADVERYELLSTGSLNLNKHWEMVKIKNNSVLLKKYNMGLIPIKHENNEASEKIILVGGFDDEYDYSSSVVKIELLMNEPSIFVNEDVTNGLPSDGNCSFWYEKNFHLMLNDYENEPIAVNFNCFNNIFVYYLTKNQFKLYTNTYLNN